MKRITILVLNLCLLNFVPAIQAETTDLRERTLISSGSKWEDLAAYSRAVVDGDWIFISGTVPVLILKMVQCQKILMNKWTRFSRLLNLHLPKPVPLSRTWFASDAISLTENTCFPCQINFINIWMMFAQPVWQL
jgi:hypothetical protein